MNENIENLVRKGVGPECLSDEVETQLGWISCENLDFSLGPKYLNAFNYPTKIDEFDYISQFIGDAELDTVRAFYRQTNGMRLFSDHIVVPGVRLPPEGLSGLDFFNISLDLSVMSGIEYPQFAPVKGMVIASSFRRVSGKQCKLVDILVENNSIVGGFFTKNSIIVDHFNSFDQWMYSRTIEAKKEFFSTRRNKLM